MAHYHLPVFLETLERYNIEPRQFYKALKEYADFATELVLEESPQLDPFAFLKLSDERDAVVAFQQLFTYQSPHLMFAPEGEDEGVEEAF